MDRNLEIELRGAVNGVAVRAAGTGTATAAGEVEVALNVEEPLVSWDPVLLAPFIVDALILMAGNTQVEDPPPAAVRSNLSLLDEFDRDAGRCSLLALLDTGPEPPLLRAQISAAEFQFELGESVASIEAAKHAAVFPLVGDRLVVTSGWQLQTRRGNGYRCLTTSHAAATFERSSVSASLTEFAMLRIERARSTAGSEVVVRGKFRDLPLG